MAAPDHLKQYQFKPKQSGNPGGRPKGIERTAREAMELRTYTAKSGIAYTGDEAAFHCLLDMFFDEKVAPRERIAAFKEWCDRGHGKAKQSVKITGDTAPGVTMARDPGEMTEPEIRKALEAIGTLKALAVVRDDTEH